MKFIFYLSLVLMFNSATMSADWSVGSFDMVRYTFNPDDSCEIKGFHEIYLYEGDEHTCEADLCFAEGYGTALVLMHPSMKAGGGWILVCVHKNSRWHEQGGRARAGV